VLNHSREQACYQPMHVDNISCLFVFYHPFSVLNFPPP
jgi:hypothetical protein